MIEQELQASVVLALPSGHSGATIPYSNAYCLLSELRWILFNLITARFTAPQTKLAGYKRNYVKWWRADSTIEELLPIKQMGFTEGTMMKMLPRNKSWGSKPINSSLTSFKMWEVQSCLPLTGLMNP